MKRPFCRLGLLWEYTITVSCHCLMPSPFMQDIQGGRPASGQRRMMEGAWRGARADREGVPDWRLTRREQGQVRLANHAI